VTPKVIEIFNNNEEELQAIYDECDSLEKVKALFKKMGYKIDKMSLWYTENLMSKNFYNETPDLDYPEFIMLLLRLSVEYKFDLVKTIPKIKKAQSSRSSNFGFKLY
jgi:hypothetical protein